MKTEFTLPLLAVAASFVLGYPTGLTAAEGSFVDKRKVEGVKISQFTYSQTLTADELTMVFSANGQLYHATRATTGDPFINPTPLTELNASGSDQTFPSLTEDGLILVFQRDPSGPTSDTDISQDLYQASRATVDAPFGSVIRLEGQVNAHADQAPHISGNGLTLYFSSRRPGGRGSADIWVATRASITDSFGAPINFDDFYPGSMVNSSAEEFAPSLSRDGLTLFFSDWFETPRRGGKGNADIWVATRPDTQAPFGTPVNLNDFSLGSTVNTSHGQTCAFISANWPAAGTKLYFATDEGTGSAINPEIWEATWKPAPTLAISGGFVTLTWALAEGNSAVETAPTANGPWTLINRPVQEIGGHLEVLVPMSAGQQYFRLVSAEGLPEGVFERRVTGAYLVDFPDGSRLLLNLGLGGVTHRESSDDFIGLTGLPDLPFHRYGGGFGNWTRTGPRTIHIVELAFHFGADGTLIGIPKVRIDLAFNPDLRSATATATVELFHPDQDPLTDTPLPGPTFERLIFRRIQ